ncbi:hypothetical protein ACFOHY_21900 [Rhizobium rosettiformans]|uniref:hypothetical protein n=1 Tax=Rhizobium rosettiformans TaxID=1368430 RepID=UPI003611FD73
MHSPSRSKERRGAAGCIGLPERLADPFAKARWVRRLSAFLSLPPAPSHPTRS